MSEGNSIESIMSSWNFSESHVDQAISSGKFISAKSVLLVAISNVSDILNALKTDPTKLTTTSIRGKAIGVVQSWALNQQKSIMPLFEIGSSLAYYIPGNVMGVANLTKVVYTGGSLLANLYRFSASDNEVDNNKAGFKVGTDEWFAINLAAKKFDKATTLLWVMKNNDNENMGAYLIKGAMVESHSISTDSSSAVIMESASMRFEQAIPMLLSAS